MLSLFLWLIIKKKSVSNQIDTLSFHSNQHIPVLQRIRNYLTVSRK